MLRLSLSLDVSQNGLQAMKCEQGAVLAEGRERAEEVEVVGVLNLAQFIEALSLAPLAQVRRGSLTDDTAFRDVPGLFDAVDCDFDLQCDAVGTSRT